MGSETRRIASDRRLRLGMIGGGRDAFIGAIHRIACRIDDAFELVAGCFASTAAKSRASGTDLGLDPDRVYRDFDEMAKREARRPDGIDAVTIVTPNHMHYPAARAFLRRGIHVICDKPMTATLPEARRLARLVERSDALFVLTHNYTGYPMVRQARAMVADGALGDLRLVQVQYAQDWLTEPLEASGHKQAVWRTDPEKSGAGGTIGDIGTHAHNLALFVTGLRLESLAADLTSFVPGRRLDDNAHVMMRFEGGARGLLWCSQVAPGCENDLRLRVYGTKGSLDWSQETPNALWHATLGGSLRRITRMGAGAREAATRVSRLPAGHPEGYLEAFATLYAEAADAIRWHGTGVDRPGDSLLPTAQDGLAGVAFVDACVRSAARKGTWVRPAVT